MTEHETNSQNLVKEKLVEYTAITPLCRSSLLVELMNEMTELKQELDDQLGAIECVCKTLKNIDSSEINAIVQRLVNSYIH